MNEKFSKIDKKGQAAMEFLMTYGWAILAALVVIGALGAYFYFKAATASSVYLSAPLYGVSIQAQAATDPDLKIEIKNNIADALIINKTYIEFTSPGNFNCTNSSSLQLAPAQTTIIAIKCPTLNFTSGDRIKGDIVITYTKSGSSLQQTSSGSLSGTVP